MKEGKPLRLSQKARVKGELIIENDPDEERSLFDRDDLQRNPYKTPPNKLHGDPLGNKD